MDFMKNTAIPSTLPEQIDAKLDLDKVKQECQELVKSRAKVSAGVAVVPVPFLDVAVDAGLLSKILPQITQKFQLIDDVNQLDESEDQLFKNLKDRALSFAGLVATRGMAKKTIQGFGGRIAAKQITKFVPLGGQLVSAGLGYMIFKKIAFDHIDECYRLAKHIQNSQEAQNQNSQAQNSQTQGNQSQHTDVTDVNAQNDAVQNDDVQNNDVKHDDVKHDDVQNNDVQSGDAKNNH
ncbi:hypothetical protein B0682_02365 [Moraxella lincolnii]|uniref:DUF697 domain-containing protein n=1 Tax=Lwoffella lincolnii TaxID=90241 RepID=A0A1T0CGT1_9GAMM|nr:hypothetical protein B0682_02365 [Moraxella lincolnii]